MMKLWPSQKGVLHGIVEVEKLGKFVKMTTYCNKTILVRDSKRSRSARWLRHRWIRDTCRRCRIPDWKVKRFLRGRMKKIFNE